MLMSLTTMCGLTATITINPHTNPSKSLATSVTKKLDHNSWLYRQITGTKIKIHHDRR